VPIELRTQQAVRPAQDLAFCYLCGQRFSGRRSQNRDHVPPSAIFLKPDRNFPLVLPTHYACNHDRHLDDQTIGQLVGILHEQAPDAEHLRMQLVAGIAADGQLFVAAGGRVARLASIVAGTPVCGRAQFAAANRSELAAEISRGGTVPGGPATRRRSMTGHTPIVLRWRAWHE
jgi:hypothetical protein